MEKDKQSFLEALRINNGKVDEYTLGNALGFADDKVKKIIDVLVQEGKIEFQSFGLCSYKVKQ